MNAGAGKPDSAGVPLPPPLIYLTAYGAAVAADILLPLPAPGGWAGPAGALLAIAGFLPLAWALLRFARAHVNPLPTRAVDTLVIAGPYRYTRNPMYLGMLLLYLGVALLTRLTWALLLAPVVVLLVNRIVIAREEAYLTRRFGAEYGAYRSTVRRWL